MIKLEKRCKIYETIFGCYSDNCSKCPKIKMATQGLCIPSEHPDTSYIDHAPFGVYMALKRIIKKIGVGKNGNKNNNTKTRRNSSISR